MRLLATISSEEPAKQFHQYLLSLPIPASLEPGGRGWQIWIECEDDLERAGQELVQFQADPGNPRYRNTASKAKAYEREQEEREVRLRRNYIDYRTERGSGSGLAQRSAPATAVLIALCILFAVLTHLGQKADPYGYVLTIENTAPEHLIEQQNEQLRTYLQRQAELGNAEPRPWFHFMVFPPTFSSIREGQVWRLFTPMFLHYGPMHLIFNLWWLWSLGLLLERRNGTLHFLLLVLVSQLISGVAEYFWSGPTFGGMSGVIYALFGYTWIYGRTNPAADFVVPRQTVTIMLGWLVLCMTGILGPIANAAHVAGLLTGMAWAGIGSLSLAGRGRRRG